MPRLIDVMHQGLDRVIGAWQEGDVIVDPGPEPCLRNLLDGFEGEAPRALLLTHIHLDHAGATGALVRRFPALKVYVHEIGAPHLVDPGKLLSSAARLYGDDMRRLWGEIVPVPEENVVALRGGESIEGFRVTYTPGHASHHVAFLHEASGDAYVGDVGGVRIPPSELILAPTPPPDIDLEAWERSLDAVADWSPLRLRLTHFGTAEDVGAQLAALRAALRGCAERARKLEREQFIATLRDAVATGADPATAERYELATPPEHVWLGLERYHAKANSKSAPAV